MRNDVKISLAALLFVALVVVVYLVVFVGGQGRPNEPVDNDLSASSPFSNVVQPKEGGKDDLAKPEGELVAEGAADAEVKIAVESTTPWAELSDSDKDELDVVPWAPMPGDTETSADATNDYAGATLETTPRTYKIKKGDSYSVISEDVYGTAKYAKMIEKANPDMPALNLRIGAEITIPPRPIGKVALQPAPRARPGDLVPAVDGATYVVKKGDSYWKIAKQVCGSVGKTAALVKANTVSPMQLRPGMRIRIPAALMGAGGSPRVAARPRPDWASYLVSEDDNGFQAVARRVYRDASLASALERANPGVKSTKLRVGMVLNVPPADEAKQMARLDLSAGRTVAAKTPNKKKTSTGGAFD